MNQHITLRKATGTWVVRADGAVIGETDEAVLLEERGLQPVVYFPRDAVAMAFLAKTDKTTHCPHKGDASYYSIKAESTTIEYAAWSYEDPKEGMEGIKDLLAFHETGQVVVERI